MKVDRLVVGMLDENCYFITKDDKTIIIDPGAEPERIIDYCKDLNIVEVLITHHHFDHIGALKEVLEYFNLKENERSGYFDYEVIKTPGHTSDSLTYYFKDDDIMFTGDFLFYHSIGRTDLPTGNDKDLMSSLNKIFKYPLNTICYPGHGKSTTLEEEYKSKRY